MRSGSEFVTGPVQQHRKWAFPGQLEERRTGSPSRQRYCSSTVAFTSHGDLSDRQPFVTNSNTAPLCVLRRLAPALPVNVKRPRQAKKNPAS
jgi:hypothetical protein